MVREVLVSDILAMDEKPIKATVNKEKHKINRTYFWTMYGDDGQVVLQFVPNRNHENVWKLLKGKFKGVLVTDDYAGYTSFCASEPEVTHALCWSHTRRYFVDALIVEPEACRKVVEQIDLLYEVERLVKKQKLSKEQKAVARLQKSTELVDALFAHLKRELENSCLLPKSPYTVAINYTLDNEKALRVFLTNPDVPLDTNHVEREHKKVAIEQRNRLFWQTAEGAEYLGVLYSLIFSASNLGLNPRHYLTELIHVAPILSEEQLAAFTPLQWSKRQSLSPPE
jgi:hypothetical protein